MTKTKLTKLLNTNFIILNENSTVKNALKAWEKLVHPSKTSHIIYIVNDEKKLVGTVDLRELFMEKPNIPIKKLVSRDFVCVKDHMTVSAAIGVVIENKLSEVPVVDKENRIVGIVLSEDLLDALDWTHKKNINRLSGILDNEERVDITKHSIFTIIRSRVLWLIAAVFGGIFLAGEVIRNFTASIVTVPILAVFIPVMMNIGGGIGTQTAAYFLHTLANHDPEGMRKLPKLVILNVLGGLFIGIILGTLVAIISFALFGDSKLSIVLFTSMTIIGVTGVIVGFLVPAITSFLGKDPTASTPLITMVKDATTLIIYFVIVDLMYL